MLLAGQGVCTGGVGRHAHRVPVPASSDQASCLLESALADPQRLAPRPPAGEWAEGDAADAALHAATPSSSSGYSLPSSSCPEEVSWPPLADGPLGSGSSDCYAAVNLMTMSAKQRSGGSGGAPAPAGGLFSAAPAPAPAPFVGAGPGSSVGGSSAAASPALSGGTLGAAAATASRPHSSLDVEQFNHDSMAALAAKYDGTAAPRHHKASAAVGRGVAGLLVVAPGRGPLSSPFQQLVTA